MGHGSEDRTGNEDPGWDEATVKSSLKTQIKPQKQPNKQKEKHHIKVQEPWAKSPQGFNNKRERQEEEKAFMLQVIGDDVDQVSWSRDLGQVGRDQDTEQNHSQPEQIKEGGRAEGGSRKKPTQQEGFLQLNIYC